MQNTEEDVVMEPIQQVRILNPKQEQRAQSLFNKLNSQQIKVTSS